MYDTRFFFLNFSVMLIHIVTNFINLCNNKCWKIWNKGKLWLSCERTAIHETVIYSGRREKGVLNPFAPGDFAEKRVFELVEWFSGHCRAIKSENLPQTGLQVVHLAAFWSRCKISACEVRACAESKKFKSGTAVLTFTFRFLSSPLFSLFLPHFFFSCWAFSRLHLGGKSF